MKNKDNNIEFIRQLVQTQCFHKFIEQTSLGGKNQTESMAVFFEMNIELLIESSLKKLKAAQQEMIDQTKVNLGQPVKFKFNGILAKYVDGIKKRENKLRSLELTELEQAEAE